jgi:hypothetical protein
LLPVHFLYLLTSYFFVQDVNETPVEIQDKSLDDPQQATRDKPQLLTVEVSEPESAEEPIIQAHFLLL